LAKDRKPESGRASGGASRAGAAGGKGGRTRPPVTNVVAPQRPWGLIAAAVAVLVFAAAVLTYAVLQVNEAEAGRVDAVDEIEGVQTFDYAAGQQHVTTPVTYEQSPPVGGPHDGEWADCTGTVYDVQIRQENAVHSLEHGAVWITYDPEVVSGDALDTLTAFADESGRMVSPNPGQDSAISLQSWNHQLKVDSGDDPRIAQFADFLTYNQEFYPEPGASCENPQFISDPLVVGDSSRGAAASMTDAPTTPSP
jgi:Protein of unknown function (DUF3105)